MATIRPETTDAIEAGTALAPVTPSERIAELDFLRGFALLGIAIINLPGFFVPWGLMAAGDDLYPAWYDKTAFWLVNFLGSGKFNSIFSFLFGVGFAIQLERASARVAPFVGVYLRRLLALFVFGVAHALLIWNGDVLHIYAVLGIPLLLLRKASDRWIALVAAVALLAPVVKDAVEVARQEPPKHTAEEDRKRGEEQIRVFGHGTYAEAVALRTRETKEDYLEHGGGWFAAVLGTTLALGFIAGRRRVFQDLPAYLPMIRRLTWWSCGLGLALAAAFATVSAMADPAVRTPTFLGLLGGALYVLGRPVLCLFYICAIVLLAQHPATRRLMAPLASVGRMPLTNYLMQSVIASFIFYGYGLGYYNHIGPAVGIVVAVGIYALQVVYSNLWMSRFRFGPMEWLWRTLTYGKPPAHTLHPG